MTMAMNMHAFNLLLCVLILIHASVTKAANVTEQQLQEIALSLEMFVDELPEMPTLQGYTFGQDGHLKAGELRIGMFEKKCVQILSILHFIILCGSYFSVHGDDSSVLHVCVVLTEISQRFSCEYCVCIWDVQGERDCARSHDRSHPRRGDFRHMGKSSASSTYSSVGSKRRDCPT